MPEQHWFDGSKIKLRDIAPNPRCPDLAE